MSIHAWGYGSLLLIAAGLYAWVSIESARVDAKTAEVERYKTTVAGLQGSLDQARAVNKQNVDEMARLQADLDREAEASLRFEDLARTRAEQLNKALKRISDAPASDDGPVAPVLARELERLRLAYDAATARGADAGAGGAPQGP